jgi:hypothetical protein
MNQPRAERGEDMDQRKDDQLSKTDMAEGRDASTDAPPPRSSWVLPPEPEAATPVAEEPAEEAGGPPAHATHAEALTDAPPSTPHLPENGRTEAVSAPESQPELEEPVESRDHESPELDRPQPEAPAEAPIELMAVDSRKEYRARWDGIQTGFVDDPAEAVREADHLVADVMEHLATTFAEERGRLEERWSQGTEDTEHLRTALQRYRQFLSLLLEE